MSESLFVTPDTEVISGATFSDDGLYRYRLWRTWNPNLPTMVWIMLNPSTADAEVDDPTIRRCIGFAKREGCGGIEVVNLYALRATKPAHLLHHPDPEGPLNWMHWKSVVNDPRTSAVVVAWGAGAEAGGLPGSKANHMGILADGSNKAVCLGATKSGHPRHPLYVKADAPFVPFLWLPVPPEGR